MQIGNNPALHILQLWAKKEEEKKRVNQSLGIHVFHSISLSNQNKICTLVYPTQLY